MNYRNVIDEWNSQADAANGWDSLGEDKKIEFAISVERKRCASICDGLRNVAEQSNSGKNGRAAMKMAATCAKLITADAEEE